MRLVQCHRSGIYEHEPFQEPTYVNSEKKMEEMRAFMRVKDGMGIQETEGNGYMTV